MKTLARWGLCGLALTACVTPMPTVLEHPDSRQQINCTVAAQEAFAAQPRLSTGKDVPSSAWLIESARPYDYERQCVNSLKRDGFICVSGC